MEDFFKDVTNCPSSSTLTHFTYNNEYSDPLSDIITDIVDPRLYQAALQAEQEQSITPLVKEELRLYIQHKRCEEGKDTIQVNFTQPKIHPLTQQEVTKRERRKEQNRKAATRCRRKKQDTNQKTEQELSRLRQVNKDLDDSVIGLSHEINDIKAVLRKHRLSGECSLIETLYDARNINKNTTCTNKELLTLPENLHEDFLQ